MTTIPPERLLSRRQRLALTATLAALAVFVAAALSLARDEVSQRLIAGLRAVDIAPAQPGSANSGIRPGVALNKLERGDVPYPDDSFEGPVFTIRTPGAVYDGWEFQRLVEVAAPGVIFRNCLFTGSDVVVRGAALLKVLHDPGAGGVPSALVVDSTFLPRHPNAQLDGVRGSNFTLDRVEISGTVDGAHVYGSRDDDDPRTGNVRIIRSWIHDLSHFDDRSHRDGTHNDGVQVVGGRRIAVVASRIDGEIQNAAVMITQDRSEVADVWVDGNWLAGGGCSINVFDNGSAIPGLRLTGNTFLRDSQRVRGCGVTVSKRSLALVSQDGTRWVDGWAVAASDG